MKPRAKLFILVFLMQMVATEDTQSSEIQNTTDNTGAFEKLKQTLSSSLLTAQDKGKCKRKCYRSLMIYHTSTSTKNWLKCNFHFYYDSILLILLSISPYQY